MKKLVLLLSLGLVGCSSAIITNSEPLKNPNEVKHVCVKQGKAEYFAKALSESLNKRNISTEIYKTDPQPSCKYLLAYSLADRNGLAVRAKVRLSIKNGESLVSLGEVSYKQRGEEKERAARTGVQGQTDLMISELFKNHK